MSVTKENLQEALNLHTEWLAYKAWENKDEETRGEEPPKGKQFSRADLSYADLSYANLSDANLSYADLSDAHLRRADLRLANLSDAYLSDANLSYADLRRANLRRAVGNGREIKSMQTDVYLCSWTNTTLAIGCQQHPLKDWLEFSDEKKARFASDGLPYLNKWLPMLDSIGVFDPLKETPLHEGGKPNE